MTLTHTYTASLSLSHALLLIVIFYNNKTLFLLLFLNIVYFFLFYFIKNEYLNNTLYVCVLYV